MPKRTRLSPAILEAALAGLESQRRRIEDQIAHINGLLGTGRPKSAAGETAKPRRRLSAAARKRIADAQRKRWAAIKKKAAKQGTGRG